MTQRYSDESSPEDELNEPTPVMEANLPKNVGILKDSNLNKVFKDPESN